MKQRTISKTGNTPHKYLSTINKPSNKNTKKIKLAEVKYVVDWSNLRKSTGSAKGYNHLGNTTRN